MRYPKKRKKRLGAPWGCKCRTWKENWNDEGVSWKSNADLKIIGEEKFAQYEASKADDGKIVNYVDRATRNGSVWKRDNVRN